ncbi:LAGLIDADG family homing endonuclease [Candidatus Parcubacteria bacterium]|nr:LAGLIDADG family homing endonuclease [Candidatus Parcubacteria bacterium]
MSKSLYADNQQGSLRQLADDPSETTRRAPLSKREIQSYFLGAIHDGTFSSNQRFRISQKGTQWLKFLQKLFGKLGYNSWIYKEGKNRKVYVLETLADFLDFRFDPSRLNTKEEKIGYIKGFFDAEGGIPRDHKARFYIQLTQNDEEKLKKLKVMLSDLGIKTGKIHNPSQKVDPDYWRMYVLAGSQKTFVEKIGSWHPRKIRTLNQRFKNLDSFGIKNFRKEGEDIVHAL